MATTRFESDLHVAGGISSETMSIPAATVTNAMVNGSAGIATTKLVHRYHAMYAQESATTAADEARPLFVVYGATGTVQSFKAGSVVANIGDSAVEVDLLKDGVSILTAVISLDSTNAAYTPEAGTINTAAVVAGDVLEVSIDATIGTGTLALGVYCELMVDEVAA